jgi:hypothetical protein
VSRAASREAAICDTHFMRMTFGAVLVCLAVKPRDERGLCVSWPAALKKSSKLQRDELPELSTTSCPEARDSSNRMHGDLVEEQRSVLGWRLRQHASDSVLDIAREVGMNPEAIRLLMMVLGVS